MALELTLKRQWNSKEWERELKRKKGEEKQRGRGKKRKFYAHLLKYLQVQKLILTF